MLFIHQNGPGQFKFLAPHLARNPAHQVVFLSQAAFQDAGDVLVRTYTAPRPPSPTAHPYLQRIEASVRRGQAVVRACQQLAEDGFRPDIVIGHAGWGETLFLREALPGAKILSYCELFYRPDGQDTGYLPELALDFDGSCRLRAWNADLLVGLDAMHLGLSPTAWQRAQHPAVFQSRIAVIHEGVDLAEVAPAPQARFVLPGGQILTLQDEVVTFVARNLEPVRGFLTLMRALPELMRRRPRAHIVICGETGVSYGAPPPGGGSWRDLMLRDAGFDRSRVHFVSRLARQPYLRLLQVSSLHLYLTVPFVLSWSLIEAMAAGCLVLASDVAPVREVLDDGTNGFLVDMRQPAQVAARAVALLEDRAGLGRIRHAARRTASDRFDVRQCLAAQTALIESMLN